MKYETARLNAEKIYKTFKPIKSNALKGKVINFNSEGFNHLLFKNSRNVRNQNEQILRFGLIELAYKVLKISTTLQEYEELIQEFKVKRKKGIILENKIAKYWGFIAIIAGRKIKVIVRQIGDGNIHFWSVIPFWRTTKHGDYKFKSFSTGDLIED